MKNHRGCNWPYGRSGSIGVFATLTFNISSIPRCRVLDERLLRGEILHLFICPMYSLMSDVLRGFLNHLSKDYLVSQYPTGIDADVLEKYFKTTNLVKSYDSVQIKEEPFFGTLSFLCCLFLS